MGGGVCACDEMYSFSNVLIVVSGSCGGGVAIRCIGGGNKFLACCKVYLISFREALNLILNYHGDKMCWVVGFWIWVW